MKTRQVKNFTIIFVTMIIASIISISHYYNSEKNVTEYERAVFKKINMSLITFEQAYFMIKKNIEENTLSLHNYTFNQLKDYCLIDFNEGINYDTPHNYAFISRIESCNEVNPPKTGEIANLFSMLISVDSLINIIYLERGNGLDIIIPSDHHHRASEIRNNIILRDSIPSVNTGAVFSLKDNSIYIQKYITNVDAMLWMEITLPNPEYGQVFLSNVDKKIAVEKFIDELSEHNYLNYELEPSDYILMNLKAILLVMFSILATSFSYFRIMYTRTFLTLGKDPLTSLYNRRGLKHKLSQLEFERGAFDILAIFDIDHFKKINDNFGHIKGDQVIQYVAMVLKSGLRQTDIVSRVGGEEFVVLLRTSRPEVAISKLESIRHTIGAKAELGTNVKFTVSCGATVQSVVADQPDYEKLFDLADIALYQSKGSGRDMLSLNSPPDGLDHAEELSIKACN